MADIKQDKLWTGNFILIMLINFFLFCSFQMYPAALPPYVKGLGAPDHLLGWLTGIATIATLLMRAVAGVALDRLGRKIFFLLGMFVMLLACLGLYLLPLVGAVLALRFIHGMGWGAASTASNTIAADNIPKSRFGEGMGYFSLSASLAMAIAPALALSLRPDLMFLCSAAFILLALLLAGRLQYKEISPAPKQSKGSFSPYEIKAVPAALLMGLVTLTYGSLMTFLAVYAATRGIANIGPFFVVYALSMLATRPPIGKLIDRRGQEVVILPGLGLILLALLLLSQATSLLSFLLCAVLYAVGQSCLHTSAQSLAVLNSPRDRVGAANATFLTGFDGGIGLGAVLSGFLAAKYGYAEMFRILMIFPLLAAGLYLFALRQKQGKG